MMLILHLIVLLFTGIDAEPQVVCPVNSHDYTYDTSSEYGPDHWSDLSSCCGGQYQSPVDIVKVLNIPCVQSQELVFTGYKKTISGELSNKGHAAGISFKADDTSSLNIDPSILDQQYVLDGIHFHVPSEHHVNGEAFDGELHFVHYKKQYGDVATAVTHSDGLAVVGVFMTKSLSAKESELNRLLKKVADIDDTSVKVKVKVDPDSLLPNDRDYYTYQGSLTTPPCSEAVTWIVMDEPVLITTENLELLQNLPTNDGEPTISYGNARPVEDLGSREVVEKSQCTS